VILDIAQHDLAKAYFNSPTPAPGGGGLSSMCFTEVLRRLMGGLYSGPAEVYGDIAAMWAHCRAVHPPGSDPARAAEQLAPLLDLLWRRAGLDAAGPLHAQQQLYSQQAQQQAAAQQRQQLGGLQPRMVSPGLPPEACSAEALVRRRRQRRWRRCLRPQHWPQSSFDATAMLPSA
jgi:hypothetical protein